MMEESKSMLRQIGVVALAAATSAGALLCGGCSDSDYEIRALRKEVNQLKADVRDLKRRGERRFVMERSGRTVPAAADQNEEEASNQRQTGDESADKRSRYGRTSRPSREEIEARRNAMRNPETRKKIIEEHKARMEERRRRHEERRREIENSIKSNTNTTNKED